MPIEPLVLFRPDIDSIEWLRITIEFARILLPRGEVLIPCSVALSSKRKIF